MNCIPSKECIVNSFPSPEIRELAEYGEVGFRDTRFPSVVYYLSAWIATTTPVREKVLPAVDGLIQPAFDNGRPSAE